MSLKNINLPPTAFYYNSHHDNKLPSSSLNHPNSRTFDNNLNILSPLLSEKHPLRNKSLRNTFSWLKSEWVPMMLSMSIS